MLEITDLNFSYGDKLIFRNASFYAQRGDRVCILGENGSGKTTFLRILAGILFCEMKMNFFGVYDTNVRSVIQRIGFIPDKPYLYDYLTGKENIELIMNIFGESSAKSKVESLCKEFELHEALDNYVKDYSLGMKHKLYMACILSREVDLLLLDEPLSALDEKAQKIALEKLFDFSKRGGVIIFTTHIESVSNCLATKKYIIHDYQLKLLNNA